MKNTIGVYILLTLTFYLFLLDLFWWCWLNINVLLFKILSDVGLTLMYSFSKF